MRRCCVVLAQVVCLTLGICVAHNGLAADSGVGSVSISATNSEQFRLALRDGQKDTYTVLMDYAEDAKIPLRLKLCLVQLPSGYTRTGGTTRDQDVHPDPDMQVRRGQRDAIRQTLEGECEVAAVSGAFLGAPSVDAGRALVEQRDNITAVAFYLSNGTEAARVQQDDISGLLTELKDTKPRWVVQINDVTTPAGTAIRIPTLALVWDFDAVLKKLSEGKSYTAVKVEVTLPPKEEAAKTDEAAKEKTTAAAEWSILKDFGIPFAGIAALEKTGVEIVSGVVGSSTGGEAFFGLNAYRPKRDWGLIVGKPGGDAGDYFLGATRRFGERARPFLGFTLSDDDGTWHSSPAFGLAFHVGDIINSVETKKPATTGGKMQVKVEAASQGYPARAPVKGSVIFVVPPAGVRAGAAGAAAAAGEGFWPIAVAPRGFASLAFGRDVTIHSVGYQAEPPGLGPGSRHYAGEDGLAATLETDGSSAAPLQLPLATSGKRVYLIRLKQVGLCVARLEARDTAAYEILHEETNGNTVIDGSGTLVAGQCGTAAAPEDREVWLRVKVTSAAGTQEWRRQLIFGSEPFLVVPVVGVSQAGPPKTYALRLLVVRRRDRLTGAQAATAEVCNADGATVNAAGQDALAGGKYNIGVVFGGVSQSQVLELK